jgi:uncharacterized RDD family membrane protein YckC
VLDPLDEVPMGAPVSPGSNVIPLPVRRRQAPPRPAGLLPRAAALGVDLLALMVGTGVLLFPIDVAAVAQGVDPRAALAFRVASLAGRVVLAFLYFAWMESSERQATLGKIALGLSVERAGGAPLDFRRASARLGAKLLSAAPLGLGFLAAAVGPRRRALHDHLAGTVVVHRGGASAAGIGVAAAVALVLAALALPNLLESRSVYVRFAEAVALERGAR